MLGTEFTGNNREDYISQASSCRTVRGESPSENVLNKIGQFYDATEKVLSKPETDQAPNTPQNIATANEMIEARIRIPADISYIKIREARQFLNKLGIELID